MTESDVITVVATALAVFVGYAFGVWHTRRALRDVLRRAMTPEYITDLLRRGRR